MSKTVKEEKVQRKPGFYGLNVDDKWKTIDRLMKDAVESHCNMGQDYMNFIVKGSEQMTSADRPYNDLNIAREASKAGMKGIVLTCHVGPSFFRVPVIQTAIDEWAEASGIRPVKVIGSLTLNYPVGGLNPEIVRTCARFGGKVVLMPTMDGSYDKMISGQKGGIELVKNGTIVPALEEIIGILGDNDMVMDISHVDAQERFILVDEGKKAGVNRYFVFNPGPAETKFIGATVEQWAELAKEGVKLMATANTLVFRERFDFQQNLIKKLGVDAFVSGTDLNGWGGQLLHPVDGLKKYIAQLLFNGMTESNIEKIYKINPAKLFDL